jgi:hypothetical protein
MSKIAEILVVHQEIMKSMLSTIDHLVEENKSLKGRVGTLEAQRRWAELDRRQSKLENSLVDLDRKLRGN